MDNFENETTLKIKSSSDCSNLLPTCLANCNYVIGDCRLIEVESDVKCNSMFPVEQRSIEKGQINVADWKKWSPNQHMAEDHTQCQQTITDETIQQKHEATNQQGQQCVPEPPVLPNETANSTIRTHTTLTSAQQLVLEKEFSLSKYFGQQKRQELAQKLGLSETTIRVWVQNKRAKLKLEEELKDMRSTSTINAFLKGLLSTSNSTDSSASTPPLPRQSTATIEDRLGLLPSKVLVHAPYFH